MKTLLFFTTIASLCAGCMYRYPTDSSPDTLINIPVPPHKREVAIIFPGEPMPAEEYIKVGVVEAKGSEYTSYNTLIRRLQEEAQALGMDAVQLFGKQYYTDENIITENVLVETSLSGLGIRYLKNMDYLSDYVKTQVAYTFNDTTQQYDHWAVSASVDFDGSMQSAEGNKELYHQLRQYSLDYLLYEETPAWSYLQDEFERVTRRVKRNVNYTELKCWFTYAPGTRLVAEAKIEQYPSRQEQRILFSYDDEYCLIEKLIEQAGELLLIERLAYDERGRLAASTFLRLENEVPHPYAQIRYEYHSPEEVVKKLTAK